MAMLSRPPEELPPSQSSPASGGGRACTGCRGKPGQGIIARSKEGKGHVIVEAIYVQSLLESCSRSRLRGRRANEKARHVSGLFVPSHRGHCPGSKAITRRVVTGAATGSKRQRRTAAIASRSNTRGGLARTTRALVT